MQKKKPARKPAKEYISAMNAAKAVALLQDNRTVFADMSVKEVMAWVRSVSGIVVQPAWTRKRLTWLGIAYVTGDMAKDRKAAEEQQRQLLQRVSDLEAQLANMRVGAIQLDAAVEERIAVLVDERLKDIEANSEAIESVPPPTRKVFIDRIITTSRLSSQLADVCQKLRLAVTELNERRLRELQDAGYVSDELTAEIDATAVVYQLLQDIPDTLNAVQRQHSTTSRQLKAQAASPNKYDASRERLVSGKDGHGVQLLLPSFD
jgi:hypothetical protein